MASNHPEYDPEGGDGADTPAEAQDIAPDATVPPAPDGNSFVVVANRLPVDEVTGPDGSTSWRRSPGGLVSALEPVMRRLDGAWVGWVGSPSPEPEGAGPDGRPTR